MTLLEELKSKKSLTRSDIAALLASIGEPGKNREEKLEAVRQLHKFNFQRYGIETTLETYLEY